MSKVLTLDKFNSSGNASGQWAEEISKVLGNKLCRIVIEKEYPNGTNTFGKIPFVNGEIISQVDENGDNEILFEFDNNHDLVPRTGTVITNLISMTFNDKFRIRRNTGGSGTADAADQFSVTSLFERSGLAQTETEIMEPIADTYDIAVGAEFLKRRKYFDDVLLDLNDKIDTTYKWGWNIKDLDSTEMQLKKIRIIIEIKWYEPISVLDTLELKEEVE